MTKSEILEWCKSAEFYEAVDVETDSDGTVTYNTKIFIKDGRYYAVLFYDNTVLDNQDGPIEVVLKSRVITEYYFETAGDDPEWIGQAYRPEREEWFKNNALTAREL